MKLEYQIQFLSDWNCGSGLSSGAEADYEVLKDDQQLPYIPGKTLKGLFREALGEMMPFDNDVDEQTIMKLFGGEVYENGTVKRTSAGCLFFSNAELSSLEQKDLTTNGLAEYLYVIHSSTQMNKEGVVKDKSLRSFEVCIPVILHGFIDGVSDNEKDLLTRTAKWIRAIGGKRNRGFGRCKFTVK